MVDDDRISPADLRRIADQALTLQEHVLRRAWGLVFGVTAANIAVVLVLPLVVRAAGLSEAYGLLPRVLANTAVSLVGDAFDIWIFKRILDTSRVTRALRGSLWARTLRPATALAFFGACVAVLLGALVFLRPDFVVVLFALEATLLPLFYLGLRVSFPNRLPAEGIAALGVYALADLGSLAVALLRGSAAAYGLLWAVAVAGFVLAFLRARSAPPPIPPEVGLE